MIQKIPEKLFTQHPVVKAITIESRHKPEIISVISLSAKVIIIGSWLDPAAIRNYHCRVLRA